VAEIPKWPNFSLRHEVHQGTDIWVVRTDTGRPKTPIFSLMVTNGMGVMNREEARRAARIELDTRYARAHPNGCPES
jgi:hypothetical protein